MKAQWSKVAKRYDVLQRRERWLVAAGVMGGIVLLAYAFFIEPALKSAQLAERSVAEQRVQLANAQAQMLALQSPGQNPDVAARRELDSLKTQLDELGVPGARFTVEASDGRVFKGTLDADGKARVPIPKGAAKVCFPDYDTGCVKHK